MALSIYHFARILLAELAENTTIINFYNPDIKTADIPFNYREVIENILCADNGWKEEFSPLIDIERYFKEHFYWEEQFATEIMNVANNLGKEIVFDLRRDHFCVIFSPEEIQDIKKEYDIEIIEVAEHFAILLTEFIFTRRYKEQVLDYSARTSAKMRERNSQENK